MAPFKSTGPLKALHNTHSRIDQAANQEQQPLPLTQTWRCLQGQYLAQGHFDFQQDSTAKLTATCLYIQLYVRSHLDTTVLGAQC